MGVYGSSGCDCGDDGSGDNKEYAKSCSSSI